MVREPPCLVYYLSIPFILVKMTSPVKPASSLGHGQTMFQTVEMHAGGEPLRIIYSGYPEIEGNTILLKRRYVLQKLDHFWKLLMYQPRGNNDM